MLETDTGMGVGIGVLLVAFVALFIGGFTLRAARSSASSRIEA